MNATSGESALKARKKGLRGGDHGPTGLFFRNFLKRPAMVGAIVPSSIWTIRRILKRVDWANTKLFVEYGPGVGTFCNHVLERLAPDATYIAIDPNPDFIAYLRRKIADSRFIAIEGSAADVREIIASQGFEHADYVLSGLPFSNLPAGVGAEIAGETHAALRPGGAFIVYQYSPKCRRFITPHFKRIDHETEVLNLPPNQIYWAWKD